MSGEGKSAKRVPGKVFWPLMIASGAAVAVAGAVVGAGRLWEWLRYGPSPEAPVTDLSEVHPGEPPFGASDFSSRTDG